MRLLIPTAIAAMVFLTGCRHEEALIKPGEEQVGPSEPTEVVGFYLLNEGNMGSNKSTLDYYDALEGVYYRNIFGAANPDVVKELGDVGNDLQIYGDRLYAVINASNKIDVMRVSDCRKIGQIDIPNVRHIAFDGSYAYATSYAGPIEISEDYRQRGYVAKIDTATMVVIDRVDVGYQPDGIGVSGGKLYVANSGGYMVPNYESTMTVIDIATFTIDKTIDIDINLDCVVVDGAGGVWVSSRGDYYSKPSHLYCYDPASDALVASIDVGVGSMWLDDDFLYIVALGWSYETMSDEATYAVVDTGTKEVVTRRFVADETAAAIVKPYGVAVNPSTKEIYVTDAGNYVNPGRLYCFGSDGVKKWDVRTGDIPAHFAFVKR